MPAAPAAAAALQRPEIRRIKLTVAPADEGERLDRYLSARGGISRGEARRALERGGVYLEGSRCKVASKAVRAGQSVEAVLEEAGRVEKAPAAPLVVLHEDEQLLAVAKPAGVASQPTLTGDVGTLPWLVGKHLGRKAAEVPTVHRLDRDTSGVVVFGKTATATRALAAAFREGTAQKEYQAVVVGRLEGSGVVEAPLGPAPGRKGSHAVVASGSPAVTRWEVLAHHGDDATLVRLLPETGRTHQLRVHLAHLGHPIVGDSRYGGPPRAGAVEAPRFLLHARALELPHPSGGTIRLEAPFPPDFAAAAGIFSLESPPAG
ncbi:RluA family pseudouridine synthase [Vulgatibacter sp.]|uniref:RluA family pseudouridine synthase n=1 Tax=Vulgatibacter sp. TaxID=1971226 RepID=UPI00356615B5